MRDTGLNQCQKSLHQPQTTYAFYLSATLSKNIFHEKMKDRAGQQHILNLFFTINIIHIAAFRNQVSFSDVVDGPYEQTCLNISEPEGVEKHMKSF